jgi:hypothetical protein
VGIKEARRLHTTVLLPWLTFQLSAFTDRHVTMCWPGHGPTRLLPVLRCFCRPSQVWDSSTGICTQTLANAHAGTVCAMLPYAVSTAKRACVCAHAHVCVWGEVDAGCR